MLVYSLVSEVQAFVSSVRHENKTVGFIPTMGALHRGHLSLVNKSVIENDFTIVSIFVNPTQFNDPKDLESYPRDFEADSKLLENIGCDLVFKPTVSEMYPEKDTRKFTFDGIEKRMEGEHRPGHFNGVAQIVSKLFDAVPANNAYFGLKDFQQLAIIKHLVRQLKLNINIVPCDIVREENGLAMSSRNERLNDSTRSEAGIIYSTLLEVKNRKSDSSIQQLKKFVSEAFYANKKFEIEYFEIVNSNTLLPVVNKGGIEVVACIAVWADNVRLIDNIVFNF